MAATNFKHLGVKDVDGIAVVSFINDPLMFQTSVVEQIGDELNSLISDRGYSKIVLDFSSVQYVSSTMLAKLTSLERRLEIAKGRLTLCGLGPILMDTIRIGHLERIFSIHDDVESAVRSLNAG